MVLTSLDALVLVFVGASALGVLATCLMFLMKNDLVRKISFYFLAAEGMVLALMNAASTPADYAAEITAGWVLGALSVIALLIQVFVKHEKRFIFTRILIIVPVILGIINVFMY